MAFDELLRQLMDERRMSGAELARRLGGRNPSLVTRWRNGEDRPRPQTVAEIAAIFEVDAKLLLQSAGYLPVDSNTHDERRSLDPRRAALISIVRDDVPDEDLTALERMLAGYRVPRNFQLEEADRAFSCWSVPKYLSEIAFEQARATAPTAAA